MTSVWGDRYICFDINIKQNIHALKEISRGTPLTGAIFVFLFISLRKNRCKEKQNKTKPKSKTRPQCNRTLSASCPTPTPSCWCTETSGETEFSDCCHGHSAHTASPGFQPAMMGRGWLLTSTSSQHGGRGRDPRDRLEMTPMSCVTILIKYLQCDISWASGTPPSKSWKPHYKSQHLLSDFTWPHHQALRCVCVLLSFALFD